jgi:hypothetical protein
MLTFTSSCAPPHRSERSSSHFIIQYLLCRMNEPKHTGVAAHIRKIIGKSLNSRRIVSRKFGVVESELMLLEL